MAEWTVQFRDSESGVFVGEYLLDEIAFDIKNSEVGSFSGELALGALQYGSETQGITRDSFAPYKTDWQLWRNTTTGSVIINAGMLTSVNLNVERDSVLVSGKDWLHYLERRIYPFSPEDYITLNPDNPEGFWDSWPKQWPPDPIISGTPGEVQNPVEVREIVEEILEAMNNTTAPDGSTDGLMIISYANPDTGTLTKYQIYPGDSSTILDHIRTLSELVDGFEFDITPLGREFVMWSPRRDNGTGIVWHIQINETDPSIETAGAIIGFDWTNDGPVGTFLIGLGTKDKKVGATWTDPETRRRYRWLDKVYDYGELAPADVILEMLKDQNDLWPQKKLALTLLNPEFMSPPFWTQGRPRSLIGQRIRATHNFRPYHTVDAYFRVNGISGLVSGGNEEIQLDLEMVYEPETGNSGGLPQGV